MLISRTVCFGAHLMKTGAKKKRQTVDSGEFADRLEVQISVTVKGILHHMGPLIPRLTEMDPNRSLARCVCMISDLNSLPYSCMLKVSAPNSKPRLKDAAELYHRYFLRLYSVLFCFISLEHSYIFSSLYQDINVPKVCPEYRKLKNNLSSLCVV